MKAWSRRFMLCTNPLSRPYRNLPRCLTTFKALCFVELPCASRQLCSSASHAPGHQHHAARACARAELPPLSSLTQGPLWLRPAPAPIEVDAAPEGSKARGGELWTETHRPTCAAQVHLSLSLPPSPSSPLSLFPSPSICQYQRLPCSGPRVSSGLET